MSRNRPWSGSPYRGRKPANRLSAPAPENYQPHPQYAQQRRKCAGGSNLCLSLPRRNTPRRQRPQREYDSLAPQKHSHQWQAPVPNNTGSRADRPVYQPEPIAAEPSHMPPPVIEQPVATEPEPDTEETRPARPPLYYFEEVEETPVSASNWRHGINRFRSR
ncbi:hypothetical protein KCP74_21770 [Salmonella enterica subsp. enterica]|nr:hypothetical protein KCP74_21770 [Salmonella enterica subsp. enterica]